MSDQFVAEVGEYVTFEGRRLEPSSNYARNQFGRELDWTWLEVARMGIPIWAEEDGTLWCPEPDRHPALFIASMRQHGETFRRLALEPEPATVEECEAVAAFWRERCDADVRAEGKLAITISL